MKDRVSPLFQTPSRREFENTTCSGVFLAIFKMIRYVDTICASNYVSLLRKFCLFIYFHGNLLV